MLGGKGEAYMVVMRRRHAQIGQGPRSMQCMRAGVYMMAELGAG